MTSSPLVAIYRLPREYNQLLYIGLHADGNCSYVHAETGEYYTTSEYYTQARVAERHLLQIHPPWFQDTRLAVSEGL